MRVLVACISVASSCGASAARAARPRFCARPAALPPHIAGTFRDPIGFQQADAGQYFVFDRRAHAVYTASTASAATKIVEIGAEPGRMLDPTRVRGRPGRRQLRRRRRAATAASACRCSRRPAAGSAASRCPDARCRGWSLDNVVLNGIGSLQYTGASILMNQPETGALVTELTLDGTPIRTFGQLRPTGHEADRELHLALNVGLPLVDPDRRLLLRVLGRRAGVPEVRRRRAAPLRAAHRRPRDR